MSFAESVELLSRSSFRNSVFARDKHKCVLCGSEGQDAHHIIERRLFDDDGYYLNNGATLCGECHFRAEMTIVSTEQIRAAIGIRAVVIPSHFYKDQRYDKWGNPILPNGQRLRGELFQDSSVQKILSQGKMLGEFTNKVKYPRTYHLPWSCGVTKDDRTVADTNHFIGQQVVVTTKMDGEQTTMYKDYIHARSVNSGTHPSRSWVKTIQANIGWNIPDDWRVCGENLYAKHSIHYHNLSSYFMVFSIWDEKNICLSWDDTQEWAELLELETVPVLYKGIWNEDLVRELYQPVWNNDLMEGYVVRLAGKFHYSKFRNSVSKFVRQNHVSSGQHWFHGQAVVPNYKAVER